MGRIKLQRVYAWIGEKINCLYLRNKRTFYDRRDFDRYKWFDKR